MPIEAVMIFKCSVALCLNSTTMKGVDDGDLKPEGWVRYLAEHEDLDMSGCFVTICPDCVRNIRTIG